VIFFRIAPCKSFSLGYNVTCGFIPQFFPVKFLPHLIGIFYFLGWRIGRSAGVKEDRHSCLSFSPDRNVWPPDLNVWPPDLNVWPPDLCDFAVLSGQKHRVVDLFDRDDIVKASPIIRIGG
jgi:hypothetical protein